MNTSPDTHTAPTPTPPADYPFKRNILGLFAAMLVVLLGIFILSAYWWEQKSFGDSLSRLQHSVETNYRSAMTQEAGMLSSTLLAIRDNDRIKRSFASGDREALFKEVEPLFATLRQQHNITHFYFIQPNRINLLRVHQPARHGDRIDRYTLLKAQRERTLAYGVEIGPIGTLTLRAVIPWFDGDRLLGYIELGKEIENIAMAIKPALQVEVAILLDKSLLKRDDWENGMRMMGRTPNWEQLPRQVLVMSTLDRLPAVIATRTADGHNPINPHEQSIISENGHLYGITSTPLTDAKSAHVGTLLIVNDITAPTQLARTNLLLVVIACLLLGATLFSVFRGILGRLEKQLRDVESARQNAMQYQHTMHHMASVVNCMGDGLLVIDANGIITQANHSFTDMFDLDSTIVGHPCRESLSVDMLTLIERIQHDADKENFPLSSQVPLPGKRTANAIAALLNPHGNEPGSGEGIVFTFRDITRELEISHMKTDFIANVSHELRTPLTSVLGFAKLIRKQFDQTILPALGAHPDDKTSKVAGRIGENLGIIILEGERLTHLINDVLDLTKIEAGKVEWRSEPVAAADLITRAVAATTALFEQKELNLHAEIPEHLPPLKGDSDRLLQVIINLLSNAAKFTPHGDVVCGARRVAQGLAIYVRDSGIGISPSDQRQLFERFRQVGDTLTDKPKGTGLGLAICKQIARHHGGTITVDSTPGRGSTFTLILPLPDNAVNTLPEEDNVIRLRDYLLPDEQGSTEGRTVLVVDDEAHIRDLLRQELEAVGYHVREAVDGYDAINQAKTNPPDLIVLDVMMPGINGFDVVPVLRGAPETAQIPLIILSIIDDRQRGKQLGVDRYLTKPVRIEELIENIDSLLKQRESHKKLIVVDSDESAISSLRDTLLARGYVIDNSSRPITRVEQAQPDDLHTAIISGQHGLSGHVVSSLQMVRGQERVLLLITGHPTGKT